MIEVRGVIHNHSNYSYDGMNSIEEISVALQKSGKQFICMTEHTDYFNPAKMETFIKECERFSTHNVLIIPGLEVTCTDRSHIMGLGLKTFIPGDDQDIVVNNIHQDGGIAVLSHPLKHGIARIPNGINFIEIWNGKCAGRVLPDFKMLKFFKKLLINNQRLKGLAGLDMHHVSQMANLDIVMQLPKLNKKEVLKAIQSGQYWMELGIFTFKPNGRWPYWQWSLAHLLSGLVRIRDRLRGLQGWKIFKLLEQISKRLVGQGRFKDHDRS